MGNAMHLDNVQVDQEMKEVGMRCTAGPFLMEKEEDRVLLVKAVLHAADISNPVRPFHVNCVMSTSVHREFR